MNKLYLKKVYCILALLCMVCYPFIDFAGAPQENPVRWKFSAKKQGKNEYLVEFTATVMPPWHIYSKDNPGGIIQPTIVTFHKNPAIELVGSAVENGSFKEETEQTSGAIFKYYEYALIIKQRIKLKRPSKINVTGEINYMACTASNCLPPALTKFTIELKP